MSDIYMRILLSAQDGASGVIRNLVGVLGAGGLTGALAGLTIGLGVQSVKAAADFQQGMIKVQALAGLTAQQAQQMGQAILQMSTDVGQSPKSLADGLYYVASAGFRGADALNILRLSAEAAATGGFDTKTAADALTSALNAFGLKGKDATRIMDEMQATVAAGKMEWSNYANVVGKLSVIAKASGVSFEEANAALATLTNSGYSAHLAGTSLSNLFTQLDLKTDSMAKNAKKLGIAFDEQKFKSMSLGDQIKYLNAITGGNQAELLKMLNGNTVALKTFDALANSMKQYNNNLDSIRKSHGATFAAFQKTQAGYNQSVNRLKAAFDVLEISIGNIFLPILTSLVNALTPLVVKLADWVATNQHITDSIANASTGMLPAMRHLRDMAMDLYQTLAYWLTRSMPTLRQEFVLTSNVTQNQFLPALQSTANWMLAPGMPIYAQFAKMVRDLLGGSFRQAKQDAITMGITILQVLQGIPAHLAHLNFSQIFSQIFKIKVTGGTSPILAALGLFGLLPAIQRLLQPVLDWLGNVFGPIWHAIFDPVAAEFQQVMTDLAPYFEQFQMFWSTLFGPQQKTQTRGFGDTLKNMSEGWKQFLSTVGQIFEALFKLGMQLVMIILPPIIYLGEGIIWIFQNGIGPLIEGITAAIRWFYTGLNDVWTWINNTLEPGISNVISMVQQGWINIIQATGDFVSSIIQWFVDLYNKLVGNSIVPDLILGITGWFTSLPGRVFGAVSNFASGVASRFRNLWTTLMHDAQSILGGLGSSVVGIFRNAVNGLISAINGFIRGLDAIHINIPGIGSVGFNIPQLPYVASGGIASRGGLAMVGERGAEIVALPSGAAVYPHGSVPAGAGGVTNIFYISLSTMARSQAEVTRLVDMLEAEISHRTFSQTPGYVLI